MRRGGFEATAIAAAMEKRRVVLRERDFAVPAHAIVRALLDVCPVQLLAQLVEHHAALGKEGRSGIPDLFSSPAITQERLSNRDS